MFNKNNKNLHDVFHFVRISFDDDLSSLTEIISAFSSTPATRHPFDSSKGSRLRRRFYLYLNLQPYCSRE